MSDNFREQIEFLADRAGEERARLAEEAKPVRVRSPIRKFVIVGAFLAAAELALLAYFSLWERVQISDKVAATNRLINRPDCAGERYRTAHAILAYYRDHGAPPESLAALVGKYVASVPADPVTKRPLNYRRVANGYRLECAPEPSR